MNKRLKIAFVGNIANNFYREAKALQKSNSIIVDVFFEPKFEDSTVMPESDEPDLKGNYPSWVKPYPGFQMTSTSLFLFLMGIKFLLKNKNREWIERFNNYDLCVFSSYDSAFISFVNSKRVFRATGSDLTVLPLFSWKDFSDLRGHQEKFPLMRTIREIVFWYARRTLYKYSIRSADYVDIGFGNPFLRAANRIKIPIEKRISIFRLAIDTSIFKRRSRDFLLNRFEFSSDHFYVFLPSRIMIKKTKSLVETGQWKASDEALKGFMLFLNRLPTEKRGKVKLLIPDRARSNDLAEAKRLVEQMNLKDSVVYVKGKETDGLSRDELIDLYSISAVVLDDFGAGWYGSIVVEATSCSTPVITFVYQNIIDSLCSWHPLQIAKAPAEISEKLFALYRNRTYAKQIETQSRKWATDFHSNDVVANILERGLIKIGS